MRWIVLAVLAFALLAPSHSAAAATKSVYLADCGLAPKVKPAVLVLLCGDGAEGAKNLRWSDWGARSAHASGTGWQHDCTPDCATGHDKFFKASVVASGLRACADGTLQYASVTYTFFEPGKNETNTVKYDCVKR